MNKRDNILKAALKLFVEQGEQATSMKWIAKEAKCGIGTMYNYFESKEELINVLYLENKTKLFTYILETHDTSVSVKQQFVAIWLKFIDHAISNPLETRFLQLFSHSPKISKQVTEEVNELIYPLFEVYEKGKKEGIIKNLDTLHLVIFTNGAITSSVSYNPNISNQNKNDLVLLAWDAIKS
ncbi:MAG: TetR/AcrR family transcriptional regulator [Bacteroidales bacterium]|nr:TetR/AcrR family transcriptional regulator [Bacteroidales bacterium]